MARTRCKKQTKHGKLRLKQRSGITDKVLSQAFVRAAAVHGYSPHHLAQGEFKNYVLKKEQARNKRIKIYKGFIFIFNNTSNRLITMYSIPEKYVDEFNSFLESKSFCYLNY